MADSEGPRTPVEQRLHRLHRFAGRLLSGLDDAAEAGIEHLAVDCLTAAEAGETVLELRQVLARVEGLLLAALARADRADVAGSAPGPVAVDTAAWLAHTGVVSGRRARHDVRLAEDLTTTYVATGSALVAGRVDADQAGVIVRAVRRLPDHLGAAERAKAEQHLLGEAVRFDADQLRRLGAHLLEVVDPDAAEAELARKVQAEEDAGAATTRLELRDDGQGTTRGWFALPTRHAAMFRTALQAEANPQLSDPVRRRRTVTDPETGEESTLTRHSADVLGEAFCRLLEHLDPARHPSSGGLNASVFVTMTLETLVGGVAPATLDTGDRISAGEARRMACQAGVIPTVLGTRSQVLDLGRTARLFSRPQRAALAIRQSHRCAAEGCDRPTAWCDAHHLVGWAAGGPTDLDSGVLICPRHHTLVHHPDHHTQRLPDGSLRITRRPRDIPRRQ